MSMATAAPTKLSIEHLAVGDVLPTKDNPRKFKKVDPGLASLTASVKEKGVLQPVLVRRHPKKEGKYDLRAGARRLLACKAAGLPTIPAIVQKMTDQEALEITITENLQRDDLTPLEEAAGVKSLLDHGWEVKAVAAQLGKSTEWVVRRARLCNLAGAWLKASLDVCSAVYPWTAGHFEVIARMNQDDQDTFNSDGHFWVDMSIGDLEKQVRDHTRLLAKAPWSLTDVTLLKDRPACNVCSENSACNPGLFGKYDNADLKDARCLRRKCWNSKMTAHSERRAEGAKEEHGRGVVLVKKLSRQSEAYGPLVKKAVNETRVQRCKQSDKDAKPHMYIEGPTAGVIYYGKPKAPNVRSSSASNGAGRSTQDSTKVQLGKKREHLNRRRWKHAIDKAARVARKKSIKDLVLPKGVKARGLFVLALALSAHTGYRAAKDAAKVAKGNVDKLAEDIWKDLVAYFACDGLRYWSADWGAPNLKAARRVADLLGIDLDALKAEADKAIKEPKDLVALREKIASDKKPAPRAKKVKGGGSAPKRKVAPKK